MEAETSGYSTAALKNLKNLAAVVEPSSNGNIAPTATAAKPAKLQIPDCCICLFTVTIRQALFIGPCSHTFHYKCIRPLIEAHHPAFSCPLCRTYADLDEDVPADAGEAEEPADADTPVHESLEDGEANEQPNGAGNADGIHRQQRDDAEMSDASTAPPPVVPHPSSRPPPNASRPFSMSAPPMLPTYHTLMCTVQVPHPTSTLLHFTTISERDTDRDREAGGETEVKPDSMSPELSLFGSRTA